jgi:hypothetical protein
MRAVLKSFHSPDVWDLKHYQPAQEHNFGFLLQIMAGSEGTASEDSFDTIVCTADWLKERYANREVVNLRHHLLMVEYNYDALWKYVERICASCSGENWNEVALKLGRLGKWEFEDYTPYRPAQ